MNHWHAFLPDCAPNACVPSLHSALPHYKQDGMLLPNATHIPQLANKTYPIRGLTGFNRWRNVLVAISNRSQPSRKIGRHHIAFYRGWLQGLDLKTLADRYLETGLDLRLAKSTLTWIRDTIRQAALRNGRHGDARLLRMSISQNESQTTGTAPTLEDFQAERDPSGFYTEEELIRLFLETYPDAKNRNTAKRHGLIKRQIDALIWIESLLATEPLPNDLVSAWFDRSISDRLVLAGIATLGDLVSLVSRRGYRWWTSVPKLGERGAQRIVQWLRGYESSLGLLPDHVIQPIRTYEQQVSVPVRTATTAIAPLESFAIPAELDGRLGANRVLGTQRIPAENDLQAIHCWLATKAGNSNTQRTYRREAERLLLWSILERRKALADLDVVDCTRYGEWLSLLGRCTTDSWPYALPQSSWIAPRNTRRFSSEWRPFEGALSAKSIKHAITIAGNLFEWLVSVQYFAFNPWNAVGRTFSPAQSPEAPQDIELTRAFSGWQWQYLLDRLETLDNSEGSHRLRFALPFAYTTGLRLSELIDATTGRIYTMPLRDSPGVRWMLKVFGKGAKWRSVPLPESMIDGLSRYLVMRGLPPDPGSNPPETPLIARIGANESLSASGLYKTFREAFLDTARELQTEGHAHESAAFARASVHWLRHTCGSHLGASGVPVNLIQKLLGHASIATTSIYTDTDDETLWHELTKLGAA